MTLDEQCSYSFVVRREHSTTATLYLDIKENILGFSNWEQDDWLIGEPDDDLFPIVEIRGNDVRFTYNTQDDTVLTEVMEHLSV
jgi:hypothetical protein